MFKRLNNLKVGTKLILGNTIMIVFMAIIGLTGYKSVNNVENYLNDIFSVRLPSMDYLLEVDRDLQQLLVAERSMIFANAKSDVFKVLLQDYEKNMKQAEERWEKFKLLSATAEEMAIIPTFEKASKEWIDI